MPTVINSKDINNPNPRIMIHMGWLQYKKFFLFIARLVIKYISKKEKTRPKNPIVSQIAQVSDFVFFNIDIDWYIKK